MNAWALFFYRHEPCQRGRNVRFADELRRRMETGLCETDPYRLPPIFSSQTGWDLPEHDARDEHDVDEDAAYEFSVYEDDCRIAEEVAREKDAPLRRCVACRARRNGEYQ